MRCFPEQTKQDKEEGVDKRSKKESAVDGMFPTGRKRESEDPDTGKAVFQVKRTRGRRVQKDTMVIFIFIPVREEEFGEYLLEVNAEALVSVGLERNMNLNCW